MSVKSILCISQGSANESYAVNTAFKLAKSHKAHLRFLHISSGISVPYTGLYGEAVVVNNNDETCQYAKTQVQALAAKYHMTLNPSNPLEHDISVHFVHRVGKPDEIIAREGRLSDLVIIGRESTDILQYDSSLVSSAQFNTGRPVLFMPISKTADAAWESNNVVIGWDGSLEASRALFNALPFIKKSTSVHLMMVHEKKKKLDVEAQQGVLQYINLHGIKAEVVVIDRQDMSIGQALLMQAGRLQADLLVMGAYGHSRAHEMVFGGVTEHMLIAADLPVLFSH